MQLTADHLRLLGVRDADTWASALAPACARHGINTQARLAAFLARTLQETCNYRVLIESFDYTPERLMDVWPAHFGSENALRLGRTADHPAAQPEIAELAYGGRLGNAKAGLGDGWLYRGRGLIQLTGKANYHAFANKTGTALADLPMLLQMPAGAAESAATYWERVGCNEAADREDIEAIVHLVNGGSLGLAETCSIYRHALEVLDTVPQPAPVEPDTAPVAPSVPAPSRWAALLAAILALFRRS